ncbi:MAG: hypothetical protein JW953_17545 [Anaerolineae bacterium]|nr:hypothetical protein [Anaerolineae bacterium]
MRKETHIIAVGLAVLLIIVLVGVAGAGSSTNYTLDWQVLTGGGAPATGSSTITLNGSMGQTAIGPASNGSNVTLSAGYWFGIGQGSAPPGGEPVYLPIILRSS